MKITLDKCARSKDKQKSVQEIMTLLGHYRIKLSILNLYPLHIRIMDVMDIWPSSGTYRLIDGTVHKDGHDALRRAIEENLSCMRQHMTKKIFDADLDAQVSLLQEASVMPVAKPKKRHRKSGHLTGMDIDAMQHMKSI